MKKEYQFLKDLTLLAGIPAQEKSVNRFLKDAIQHHVEALEKDYLGSLIGIKGSNGPKVMIAGHMDEIGLMVTQITKDGFVKFQTLGGWYSQVMLAQVWDIHTQNGVVAAITGVKPPHIIPADKRNVAVDIDSMFLDIGVSSKEEAIALGVTPGNMVVPRSEFIVMGNEKYLMSKAWDNRLGSAVVVEVLKQIQDHPNRLYGAFTVQEEVGVRGAKTSAYVVEPEVAIAVDVGIANDVPGGDAQEQSLGKGPQILLYDGGLVPHQGLRKFIIKVAQEANIPYQEAIIVGGGTDAAKMHLNAKGAIAVSLCIPTRYIHSHTGIIHFDDYQNTIKLLIEVIKKLDRKTVDQLIKDEI